MVVNRALYNIIKPLFGKYPAAIIADYCLPRLKKEIKDDIIWYHNRLILNNHDRFTSRLSRYIILSNTKFI
jgi:hypothetical protein